MAGAPSTDSSFPRHRQSTSIHLQYANESDTQTERKTFVEISKCDSKFEISAVNIPRHLILHRYVLLPKRFATQWTQIDCVMSDKVFLKPFRRRSEQINIKQTLSLWSVRT